jgi:predicted nicotinamide N-methyase
MTRSDDDDDNDERPKEDDPFWEIALDHDHRYESRGQIYCFDHDDTVPLQGKITKYQLPNSSVSLELAPIATEDGIWAPVGADAWYASALLTVLVMREVSLRKEDTDDDEDRIFNERIVATSSNRKNSNIRVLELGSGAVGLSGIAFAAALSQQETRFPCWTVTLTDNDKTLLKQLEENVLSNMSNIIPSRDKNVLGNRSIQVKHLDWDDDDDDDDSNDSYSVNNDDDDDDDDDDEFKSNNKDMLSADIVIGSELAYTEETANALVKIILKLLERNPNVQIWIVQVTDRYGWSEIVIPVLESKKNNHIKIENIPLTCDIHEKASKMIQMGGVGGVGDRFAFGAVCISNVR